MLARDCCRLKNRSATDLDDSSRVDKCSVASATHPTRCVVTFPDVSRRFECVFWPGSPIFRDFCCLTLILTDTENHGFRGHSGESNAPKAAASASIYIPLLRRHRCNPSLPSDGVLALGELRFCGLAMCTRRAVDGERGGGTRRGRTRSWSAQYGSQRTGKWMQTVAWHGGSLFCAKRCIRFALSLYAFCSKCLTCAVHSVQDVKSTSFTLRSPGIHHYPARDHVKSL